MNPYDFVRFGPPAPRQPAVGHDRFKGYSGILYCRLTALTDLFIPQTQEEVTKVERGRREEEHQELTMMRGLNRMPLLPGSSLKGVLRSVAEAISGSCLTLPPPRQGQVEYRGRPPVMYEVPGQFEHCRRTDNLCPACRLFGVLSGGSSFLGKVGISDALAIGEVKTERLIIEPLMEPKPRHRAWYGDPQTRRQMFGRKFYYHRPFGSRTTTQKTKYNKTVEAVRPGTVFEFRVDYTNLTDDELALLIFSLVLEPEMCHKIGMGKPIGLGSAKVQLIVWEQVDRKSRYERLAGGIGRWEGAALVAEISRWQLHYQTTYGAWQDSLADLRRIWMWDPARKEDVKYPSQEWFQKNPNTPLKQAP